MSDLEVDIAPQPLLGAASYVEPIHIKPRKVKLHTRTSVQVERTLPHRDLRRIGAWTFLDNFSTPPGKDQMKVAAHPHTGLQTVTWLFDGKVRHQDSLGSDVQVEPGELNLMTAGYGVAHSELSVLEKSKLAGVQLWIALPDVARNNKPEFQHYSNLPTVRMKNSQLRLFAGSFAEIKSPAKFYSPLIGAEINLSDPNLEIPLDIEWEHGFLLIDGEVQINQITLEPGDLYFLPKGTINASLQSSTRAKLIFIGGEPLRDPLVIWWNFIGRNHEEILAMRFAWENHDERFPDFKNAIGERIPAPQLPNIKLTAR